MIAIQSYLIAVVLCFVKGSLRRQAVNDGIMGLTGAMEVGEDGRRCDRYKSNMIHFLYSRPDPFTFTVYSS